jgi:Domain of unknown function (DUF4440)
MVKIHGFAAVALCVALAAPFGVRLQSNPHPQAAAPTEHNPGELEQIEKEWVYAKDKSTLERIIADDFVGIGVFGGLDSKADRVQRFHPGPNPPAAAESLEDLRVRYYGDVGIVNGKVVGAYKDGKTAYEVRFTDVFNYRGGRWVAVNAQEDFIVIH